MLELPWFCMLLTHLSLRKAFHSPRRCFPPAIVSSFASFTQGGVLGERTRWPAPRSRSVLGELSVTAADLLIISALIVVFDDDDDDDDEGD